MLISVIDTPSVWSYRTVMAYKMPLGGAHPPHQFIISLSAICASENIDFIMKRFH